MQQTLKQNRHPKAAASNRNGVQSLASLAKAAQKKATQRKNGKTITLGAPDGNALVNTKNKAAAARATRKPRKFVHVAPKATAQEILDTLGIKPKTVKAVRQRMRQLGLNVSATED
jgi:hypothetical protein